MEYLKPLQEQEKKINKKLPVEPWKNDKLQFARLLYEINATQEIDTSALMESMDLSCAEIDEIFNRANQCFCTWKETVLYKKAKTP